MNFRISNKFIAQSFRCNFHRFSCVQQNITNSSSAFHTINFKYKIENRSPCIFFSKQFSKKSLCHMPVPLYTNFQKRNISNDVLELKDFDKLANTTQDLSSFDPSQVMLPYTPSIIANVSEWQIVEYAQNVLLEIHKITGLPWWASIVFTVFITRSVFSFPFAIMQLRNNAKIQMLVLEMNDISKRLKQEADYACTYKHCPEHIARKVYEMSMKKEWKELIERENCHPGKSYIQILLQVPLWFSFSIASRNLCYMLPRADINAQITYAELMVGGFGWVKNLVAVDPYMLLPISLGIVNLLTIEASILFRNAPFSKVEMWRNIFFRTLALVSIPIACFLPAATNIYWLTSSTYGLLQIFLLQSTRLRRFFRVPIVKSELEHPYRHFYSKLKSRLHLTKE